MADSDFKSKPICFPGGWLPNSRGSIIGNFQYKPDRSFKDGSGKVVCVIESSSTNDRKVGVGELCLADKFFSDCEVDGVLIFSLCGKSQYPPSPRSQAEYLDPYFRHLRSSGAPYGVKEIHFILEEAFESLRWFALDENFCARAVSLTA